MNSHALTTDLHVHKGPPGILSKKGSFSEGIPEHEYAQRFVTLLKSTPQTVQMLHADANGKRSLCQSEQHSIRIGTITAILCNACGMSERERDTFMLAAPLHDTGKKFIPTSILGKKGPLSETEWEIMRQHPVYGFKILFHFNHPILKTAAEIALLHHENWDGSGYPFGKKRHEIPFHVQIVTLADVFEALISKRSYKEAWSIERAYGEIKKLSGTKFNPQLVHIFEQCFEEIVAAIEGHRS